MTWRTGSTSISTPGFQYQGASAGGKCPVCGNPGSNCSSGKNENPNILLQDQASPETQIIRVQEDIIKEVKVGPNTVQVLKASKGDYITKSEAEKLGLI